MTTLPEVVTDYVQARRTGVPAEVAHAAAIQSVEAYEYGDHGHWMGRHTVIMNPLRTELEVLLTGAELAVTTIFAADPVLPQQRVSAEDLVSA